MNLWRFLAMYIPLHNSSYVSWHYVYFRTEQIPVKFYCNGQLLFKLISTIPNQASISYENHYRSFYCRGVFCLTNIFSQRYLILSRSVFTYISNNILYERTFQNALETQHDSSKIDTCQAPEKEISTKIREYIDIRFFNIRNLTGLVMRASYNHHF